MSSIAVSFDLGFLLPKPRTKCMMQLEHFPQQVYRRKPKSQIRHTKMRILLWLFSCLWMMLITSTVLVDPWWFVRMPSEGTTQPTSTDSALFVALLTQRRGIEGEWWLNRQASEHRYKRAGLRARVCMLITNIAEIFLALGNAEGES